MTLPEIRKALKDRRLSVLAEATGVHENTLRSIRDGRNQNPSWQVYNAIVEYLQCDASCRKGARDDAAS